MDKRAKFLRRVLLQVLLLFVGIAAPIFGGAMEPTVSGTEYQIKAAFLYKFCLYVEWPPNTFTATDSPIVLGIAGPDNLIEMLESAVKDHTVNARPLLVRRVDDNTAIAGLHLLFVARSEQTRLPQLAARAQGLPLLLVTESPGGLDDGGDINFAVQDNRIRFDIGLASTERQGLRISAQLLKVARTVRGDSTP